MIDSNDNAPLVEALSPSVEALSASGNVDVGNLTMAEESIENEIINPLR